MLDLHFPKFIFKIFLPPHAIVIIQMFKQHKPSYHDPIFKKKLRQCPLQLDSQNLH